MNCSHHWRKVFEASILGGSFPIGWECVDCKTFVSNQQITPEGLGGIVLKNAAHLYGPHGGYGRTSGGELYKEQIIDEENKVTIIR